MHTSRSRLSMGLLAGLSMAAMALATPVEPRQGMTRGAHTTRRRTNPVQRVPTHPDAEIARWNAAVDAKKAAKAERKARRRAA